MENNIPVEIQDESLAPTQEESLDNTVKTSLRERSMNSDNNYPGIQR